MNEIVDSQVNKPDKEPDKALAKLIKDTEQSFSELKADIKANKLDTTAFTDKLGNIVSQAISELKSIDNSPDYDKIVQPITNSYSDLKAEFESLKDKINNHKVESTVKAEAPDISKLEKIVANDIPKSFEKALQELEKDEELKKLLKDLTKVLKEFTTKAWSDKGTINWIGGGAGSSGVQEELIDRSGATPTVRTSSSGGASTDPDNPNYVQEAGPAPLDPNNSTMTPVTSVAPYTGTYTRLLKHTSIASFAFSDQPFTTYLHRWSNNGTSGRGGFLETSDLTTEEIEIGGFFVYYSVATTDIDNYYRVEATNDDTDQTFVEIDSWLYPDGFPGVFLSVDEAIGDFTRLLGTRSVNAGLDANDDFANLRISSRNDDNSTTTPLAGDGIFRGVWVEWQGNWVAMVTDIHADVSGQMFIDFSEDATPTDGDETSVDDSIIVSYDPTEGVKARIAPVQSRWVRIRYINDTDAQSEFTLDTAFITTAPPLVMSRMTENPQDSSLGGTVKNVEYLTDGAGEYRKITRTGTAKDVQVKEIEKDVLLRPNTFFETGQVNVTSDTPTQIPPPVKLTSVTGLSWTNTESAEDGDSLFFREENSNIITAGSILLPASSKDLHYGVEDGVQADTLNPVWLQASGTSTQNTLNIDADTEDSNTSVTPTDAMFASDDTRAIFNSTSDEVVISGFDGSGEITEANITSVKIKMEARKESGAAGETAAFGNSVITDSGSTAGGSPITSPTVTLIAGNRYFVCIARENTAAAVTNVTNTMGFDAYQVADIVEDVSNGGESRITVIEMKGTPTSNGTISVILSAASSHDVINVISVSNTLAVQDTDTDSSTSTGSFSMSANGTENGIALAFVAVELANVNTPVTNYTTRGQDGSVANDDQTLWVGTRALSSTASTSISGTMDGGTNDDMTAILLTLTPADALDPIVVVDHSEGSTQLSETVDSETDTEYEQDITNDAEWTAGLLDGLTLTISPSSIGNADLEVDRIWVEVIEAGGQVVVTYEYYGT